MKTLTKISTATFMGLLAVALSSSAFAGKPEPQAGIDAFNLCKFEYVFNEITQSSEPALVVYTEIKDTSDDGPSADPDFDGMSVQARQKGKRGGWSDLGSGTPNTPSVGPDNKTTIFLCTQEPKLKSDTHTLNAEIDIEVTNSRKGTYSGKCDDIAETTCYDADGFPVYCELWDESIVNVPQGLCPL